MTRDEKQQAWAAYIARRCAADIELARSLISCRPKTTTSLAQAMAFKRGLGELSPADFIRHRKALEARLHRFARAGLVAGWVTWDDKGRRMWCIPATVTKVS